MEHLGKKDVNIPVACSSRVKEMITRFADAEGLSNSEFVHTLIIQFIAKKKLEASLLNDIFSCEIYTK